MMSRVYGFPLVLLLSCSTLVWGQNTPAVPRTPPAEAAPEPLQPASDPGPQRPAACPIRARNM